MSYSILGVIAVLLLVSASLAGEASKYVPVRFVPFPLHTGNSIFSAMGCGIDGTIYIGGKTSSGDYMSEHNISERLRFVKLLICHRHF